MTVAIDPIPFPATGTLGTADDARKAEICVALGYTGTANGRPACPATATTGTMPTAVSRDATCAPVPVIVDGNCTMAGLTLLGGIYINGTLLPTAGGVPYVTDMQLAHTDAGQTIVIYTYTGTGTNPNKRVIIEEKRATNQTIVTRQCLKTTFTDAGACSNTGTQWWLDTSTTGKNSLNVSINQQVFTGVFSRNKDDLLLPTVLAPLDYDVVYIANADIGQVGTSNGLRRGTFSATGCTPQTAGAGGTLACHVTGVVNPTYAIYQDTGNVNNGTRLTVAADGNVWITGNLNYRIEPRGADGDFSAPIPGDATGTSADDQMDVQNVLGVVSWATPSAWVPTSRAVGSGSRVP